MTEPLRSRLNYQGQEASFVDIYHNRIPSDSVFSADNPHWYWNVSGLNSKNQVVFSTHWHTIPELRPNIRPLNEIMRWQVHLATNLMSNPPLNAYEDLKVL